jgi:uncharacterized protein (DUF305 family)
MTMTWRVLILLMTTLFVAPAPQHEPPSHSGMAAGSGWTQLMASMDRMHATMAALKPSGTIDVDFVKLMLPHHQAAIDMARTELLDGHDPQMRRLAQEIIADQESEIQLMQLWLTQHAGKEP